MENVTKNLQLVLLSIILVSTIIAVGIEIRTMFSNDLFNPNYMPQSFCSHALNFLLTKVPLGEHTTGLVNKIEKKRQE